MKIYCPSCGESVEFSTVGVGDQVDFTMPDHATPIVRNWVKISDKSDKLSLITYRPLCPLSGEDMHLWIKS